MTGETWRITPISALRVDPLRWPRCVSTDLEGDSWAVTPGYFPIVTWLRCWIKEEAGSKQYTTVTAHYMHSSNHGTLQRWPGYSKRPSLYSLSANVTMSSTCSTAERRLRRCCHVTKDERKSKKWKRLINCNDSKIESRRSSEIVSRDVCSRQFDRMLATKAEKKGKLQNN